MSVTQLPYAGDYVQIDVRGVQTVFGWTACDDRLRPPAPVGQPYENEDRDGWESYSTWIVASAAALVTAYNSSHNEDAPRVRTIRVSPQIAAHLRAAKNVYGRPAVLRHKVVSRDHGPVVHIPLSDSCQWYKEGGVRRIEVDPTCEGMELLDHEYNILT